MYFPSQCGYLPSCSDYAIEAFTFFGFWHAVGLSSCRILRCHRWSKGGWDPVPIRK